MQSLFFANLGRGRVASILAARRHGLDEAAFGKVGILAAPAPKFTRNADAAGFHLLGNDGTLIASYFLNPSQAIF